MSERRTRHTIILEILKQAKKGVVKTRLLTTANLSSTQLKKYIEKLNHAGFIEFKQGLLRTTEKGLTVIEACEICHRLLEE